MGDMIDLPESCESGEHDYDQTGRCNDCGLDRIDEPDDTAWENRRSGGAGSTSQPLTNGEYQEAKEDLLRMSGH